MNGRRDFLAGLAGAAALSASGMPLAAPGAGAELELDAPEANLEAFIKLRGDLRPEPVYDMVRGQVFGLVRGEKPRLLFKTAGAQRTVYRRVSALEYLAESRYVGLLLDPLTEQLLGRWTNPYNELACEVPATNYDTRFRMFSDGMGSVGSDAQVSRGTRPWFVIGDVLHMVEQFMSPGPAQLLPDADLMHFSCNRHQLADPALSRVPSQMAFTAVENWRSWMQMSVEGSLWWHVAGVKLDSPKAYPAELLPLIRAEAPAFFT